MPAGDLHDDPDGLDPEAGMEREAALLRSLGDREPELVDAPESVWAGIEAAVGRDVGGGDAGDGRDRPVVEREVPVVSLDERRRPPRRLLAAAAAVVVAAVLAGVGVAVWGRGSGRPTEVAAARLAALPGVDVGAAQARVRLVRSGGRLRLRVDMDRVPAPAPGTFYELWLLDGRDGTPVSIASMKDPASHISTTIPVPAGTDTDRYDIVDVSVQHVGAGPAHSGESILRGTLS
jgi:hypothetical protein